MKLKKITVDEMMDHHPCDDYTVEWVSALWDGREAIDALEILDLDISAADRLWAVTRPEVLPRRVLMLWLAEVVERALVRTDNYDPRSIAVISALWADACGDEVNWYEVKSAAWDAKPADWSSEAAWVSAAAAAWASEAAWVSAGAAAWAARAAAGAAGASRTEELSQQVSDLRRIIEAEMEGE